MPSLQPYYSPPLNHLSSNGHPGPPFQMTESIKQDGALPSCWHSSLSPLSVLLQHRNLGDVLHPTMQNGSSPCLGQEKSLNWASQKEGNIYQGFFATMNDHESTMSSSSPSPSVSQQNMQNVSSTITSQSIHPVNVAVSNGISMEMEDSRCSDVNLEKSSFVQALNPSNHRKKVQPLLPPAISTVTTSSLSLTSMSNIFETPTFPYLASLNESGLPSNPNTINISNFDTYSTQDDEFLNSIGSNFDSIL